MGVLKNQKIDSLLERTSRSFYPTLRYLPKKIREQIGLLYLLARVADTIADSKLGETETLLDLLKKYKEHTQGTHTDLPDFSTIAAIQSNDGEKDLLSNVSSVTEALNDHNDADRELILECLNIIIEGQILDLERFGPAKEGGEISSLNDDDELDDYTYRVAGCVGTFWSKISLQHLMSIPADKEDLFLQRGIRFGKALQMINILRDIPEDLRFGRCYMPADRLNEIEMNSESLLDPNNFDKFESLYNSYLDLTNNHLDEAVNYILMLPKTQFRLKASCMLPVLIGQRTVSLLRNGNVLDPENRIKVDRMQIKSYAKKILFSMMVPGGVKRLLIKNRDSGAK
ncbi:MAG: phytoene/squalene synthase family protein [Candidatus Poseidoniaceae archaeon]